MIASRILVEKLPVYHLKCWKARCKNDFPINLDDSCVDNCHWSCTVQLLSPMFNIALGFVSFWQPYGSYETINKCATSLSHVIALVFKNHRANLKGFTNGDAICNYSPDCNTSPSGQQRGMYLHDRVLIEL